MSLEMTHYPTWMESLIVTPNDLSNRLDLKHLSDSHARVPWKPKLIAPINQRFLGKRFFFSTSVGLVSIMGGATLVRIGMA